ncbi:MAG: 4-alpha-glucanotransferase [Pyrinomonadaceae bacterium]
MISTRASGILLHPTSLPGRFGIGDLGDEAYRFADFLVGAGQSLWQVLPLGSTGSGASPYSCDSAFAGNTLLVSPEKLVAAGLLLETELTAAQPFSAERVDFDRVREDKTALLAGAFECFNESGNTSLRNEYASFCRAQTFWLDDYSLFLALKEQQGGMAWSEWEPPLRRREPPALERVRTDLSRQVEAQKFYQFLLFKQWFELKQYCNAKGIRVIGDLPIFVAHDSADVWVNPGLFKLDRDGLPLVVAGVPPDYYSATGQFWGNPIYNWEAMRADGFAWWIERLRAMLRMFDLFRVDHFRGFAACWEIPAGDKTAENGRWVAAPGRALFAVAQQKLGELPIIAEDLGVITPEVDELRDALGFPGMRVMQFGFSSDRENIHLPGNYPANVVAYTATHDNDTTVGWFNELAEDGSSRPAENIEREKEFCREYLGSDGKEINWDFIEAVLASRANMAIIPLPDVLGLGSEARMNLPNTVAGNWAWRFKSNDLNENHAARLRELAELHGRVMKVGV